MATGKWTLCETRKQRILYQNTAGPCCPCVVYRVHNDGPSAVILAGVIHLDPGEDGDASGPKLDVALAQVLCPPGHRAEPHATGTYELICCSSCDCGGGSSATKTAPACSKSLGLNEQHQQQTEWCLVRNYCSASRSSTTGQARGRSACWSIRRMARPPAAWTAAPPPAISRVGQDQALTITGNLDHVVNAAQPFATVMAEIDAGRPISIAIYWSAAAAIIPPSAATTTAALTRPPSKSTTRGTARRLRTSTVSRTPITVGRIGTLLTSQGRRNKNHADSIRSRTPERRRPGARGSRWPEQAAITT